MQESDYIPRHIKHRLAVASPATRWVLKFSAYCYLISAAILAVAFVVRGSMMPGVYTHPPVELFILAHMIALIGGLATVYSAMYISTSMNWPTGIVLGGMCYAISLGAIAWGVPVLSLKTGTEPVIHQAKIIGAADISRKRFTSCRKSVSFGPWYAPGGRVCVNIPKPGILIGSTMAMHGVGNSWATRITKIEAVYRR